MDRESKTPQDLKEEGFEITDKQYDDLAMIDLKCECNCSVYDVLKVLRVLNLI